MTIAEFKLFFDFQMEFKIIELTIKAYDTNFTSDHVARTIPGILDAERPLPPDKAS